MLNGGEDARQEPSNFFSFFFFEREVEPRKTVNDVKIGVSNFCLYT